MSGPHRNPDKINTIGIVVVGICGAVLVYVSIVALQAFYMDDSSDIQTMQDYGGQDNVFRSLRAQQLENLQKYEPKAPPAGAAPQAYTISIDDAIALVARDAKKDPSNLVPAIGPAATPSVKPIFGRPLPLAAPPAGAAPAGPTTPEPTPADGAGEGSTAAPMTPTGGQGPGGGAPPGTEGQGATRVEPPPTPPKAVPTAPKAAPAAAPKAAPAAPAAAPKAAPAAPAAAPKAAPAAAPKQPAPAQPKKGNAS